MEHISVCICTYKRQELLRRLLKELGQQDTGGLFTFSIVVADNDHCRSAELVVADCAPELGVPIKYCCAPRQNIALARNKAIENATGDYLAFIDDDEFPTKRWLVCLFETRSKYDVDGVLGPVKPHFEEQPPPWVVRGKFYDRASYPTGFVIDGKKGRTGNVLFKKEILDGGQPFDPKFLTGEDQDFFGRMIQKGHVFIWCDEAVAYEAVPPTRWKRAFMLKRALLRGAISLMQPSIGAADIVKSLIAVPVYMVCLPVACVLGQHKLMSCLVRLFDHMGRLLAIFGIRPVKEPYVTE